MAKTKSKTKKTSVASTNKGTKTTNKPKNKRKPRKKFLKVKKGKQIVKGVVSVLANIGIQKGMHSIFEGRVKEADYTKGGVLDQKAYLEAIEKQKTIHAGANVGMWLMGAGNALPKEIVSSEYLEINALERGMNTLISKSKNETVKKLVPFIQAEEAIPVIEAADAISQAEFEANQEVAYLEAAGDYSVTDHDDDDDDEVEVIGIEGLSTPIPGVIEEY